MAGSQPNDCMSCEKIAGTQAGTERIVPPAAMNRRTL
jgi:hypothetical protein